MPDFLFRLLLLIYVGIPLPARYAWSAASCSRLQVGYDATKVHRSRGHAEISDFYGFHKHISLLSHDIPFKYDFQRELAEFSSEITYRSDIVTN